MFKPGEAALSYASVATLEQQGRYRGDVAMVRCEGDCACRGDWTEDLGNPEPSPNGVSVGLSYTLRGVQGVIGTPTCAIVFCAINHYQP